jgi:hypothetical protein
MKFRFVDNKERPYGLEAYQLKSVAVAVDEFEERYGDKVTKWKERAEKAARENAADAEAGVNENKIKPHAIFALLLPIALLGLWVSSMNNKPSRYERDYQATKAATFYGDGAVITDTQSDSSDPQVIASFGNDLIATATPQVSPTATPAGAPTPSPLPAGVVDNPPTTVTQTPPAGVPRSVALAAFALSIAAAFECIILFTIWRRYGDALRHKLPLLRPSS